MKLSIIIPVYNEEKTVREIIARVLKASLPAKMSRELIVVNDASRDKTLSILKSIKSSNLKILNHSVNKGKGAAVRNGIQNATGDLIIIQDADLEYNPEDYQKLLKPILSKKTTVVYGSRLINYPLQLTGKNKTPLPTHWMGNKLLTFITNLIYGSNLTDMETCYKVFKSEVIKSITLHSNRFDIEPEITSKILKKGIKIIDVPIKVTPRTHKEGKKVSWKDGFAAIWTLVKFRFTD